MGKYFRNMETNKLELHFEKSEYMQLSETEKKEIKSNFLFSKYAGAWVSRCKFPNLRRAEEVAKKLGLENDGKQGEMLTFEEQQQIKIEKAERRAERYEAKAENATERGEALQRSINIMHGDIAFFTQPNINTTAGRAFTRQRDKMWSAWEKGFEEFKKSEYYQRRAEIARETAQQASGKIDKAFCQRRIEDAEKTIKAQKRNIEAYEKKLERVENGEIFKRYNGDILTPETIESWIENSSEIIENEMSKSIYYHNLIENMGGVIFSKENIKPGYIVLLTKWKEVVTVTATGPKNITYRTSNGFYLKESYAGIEKIIEAKEPEDQAIEHPFKVNDKYLFEFWNGKEYAPKEYTVTKVTPQKVTLKHGNERARVVTVHKAWNTEKTYCLQLEGAKHFLYKDA